MHNPPTPSRLPQALAGRWESRSSATRSVDPDPTSSRKRYETGANNRSDLQHLSPRLSWEISYIIVTKNKFYIADSCFHTEERRFTVLFQGFEQHGQGPPERVATTREFPSVGRDQ